MKAGDADQLGHRIGTLVADCHYEVAYDLLAPVLAERTPFRLLDRIGRMVGANGLSRLDLFLERIAKERTEGGWVVIASALGQQLGSDLPGACSRSRIFIVDADVWYGADIAGERVPGPALVAHFEPALEQLSLWRDDSNRWVRRATGVAVHFWAKRSRGAPELATQAEMLLAFLDPMFDEWVMDAVKGAGWGLKTLGRYYPDPVTDWLVEQVCRRDRKHRALIRRKAMTYLSDEQRSRINPSA